MGVKERRERQKEILRQEILDAARELFVREGYENVSMRKIAEKIEYSPTTIYLHFQDKAELLYCLCEETFIKLMSTFKEIVGESNNPLNCLKKGLKAYILFGLKYPNHYKVTFINHPEHHENPEKFNSENAMGHQAYLRLRALVDNCVKQGQFRKVEVDLTTQVLWAGAHGLTSLLIGHRDFPWEDSEKLIDHLIETLTQSLLA